jgi:transcriptional regulator with XRE-family HTH domain
MARTFKDDLTRELQDKRFATGFGTEMAKTDLALLLIAARKAAGITQQELAARAGTTQAYIAKLESGGANPTIGKVGELLALLGFRLTPTLSNLNPYLEASLASREPQNIPVAAGKPR